MLTSPFWKNLSKPLHFSWGTGSPGKWSQHSGTFLSSGVFGQPSQAHSHANFGVSCTKPRQFLKPLAFHSGSWWPQTGMLEWLMAQKIKSKYTLWATLNIHPWKWIFPSGCILSLSWQRNRTHQVQRLLKFIPVCKNSWTATRCDAAGSSGLSGLCMSHTFVSMNSAWNERIPQKSPDTYRFS